MFNQGESQATLVPTSTAARQLFAIEMTRDGRPFPLQTEFVEGVTRFFAGGENPFPYSLDQSLSFATGEGLEWHVAVTNGTLPAGVYSMTVQMRAADGDSRPILPRAPTFVFEVRRPTDEDRPEILHREADRQLRRGAYVEAKAAIAELLRIHPQSVVGQMMRQRVASAEGNRGEVIAAIKQARTLLTTGQDALLLKFRSPEQLREALQTLPALEEPAR
jgi:hypothetical protein